MTLLEKKVDAIARSLLANDMTDRNHALIELKALMQQAPKRYENVDEAVRVALLELGVPDKLSGYPRLVRAISIVALDPKQIKPLQKGLYTAVATDFGTMPDRVERTMRHAIEVGYDRADIDVLQTYFGGTVSPLKGKPSTGEFIARVANVVRTRMKG
mgnify:FL=1